MRSATGYTERYYQEHKLAGLDYLGFGAWQQQYGRWLVESLGLKGKRLLDVGCACGSILRGLGQAGAVVQGVDVNECMIRLGRDKWPDMAPLLHSVFLIDLIDRRLITHLATNGAGLIHDFELALAGGTSEDVAKWIQLGQFGLWRETGRLNDIIRQAAGKGEGLGEAVGRIIEEERFPFSQLSLAAAGWRTGTPVSCHVGIGSDIIHSLPNCDGAALGQASYTDFLIFARAIQDLEGGVFLNIGSAVTGPEVYLKALSMARNVARQHGQAIRRFTTAVFDLVPLPADFRAGSPSRDAALYYYRPWKTLLVRTVADGGTSYYFCGDHRRTIPTLWQQLVSAGS
jgi:SAM-dependent methyltransferase